MTGCVPSPTVMTMTSLKRKTQKPDWRKYLTADELATITEIDEAKRKWLDLTAVRAGIVNRAIQRGKRAVGK